MPELPDIDAYMEALRERIAGRKLVRIRILNPFLLRTARPPIQSVEGKRVIDLRRIGKRVAIGFEEQYWLVLHLMIAGRLHWYDAGKREKGAQRIAGFDFENGTLSLTEAGTKRRASLHLVHGPESWRALDPGGVDVFRCTPAEFAERLRRENHTLKRVLTDPHLFSGIGNAYSDEILHSARLSPILLTNKVTDADVERLLQTAREVLTVWRDRLIAEAKKAFPENVTAFRPEMAVHGKFNQPCPVCRTKVQRIRYAENETDYCPTCQTGGKVLADRVLSRLLKEDWPRTVEELEGR